MAVVKYSNWRDLWGNLSSNLMSFSYGQDSSRIQIFLTINSWIGRSRSNRQDYLTYIELARSDSKQLAICTTLVDAKVQSN